MTNPMLVDRFSRKVDYLRISVTDRCDFRCVYCMPEKMKFLPRQRVLTLEEIYEIARAFVELGVRKIRLTGGEPLVRNGIVDLCRRVSGLPGLDELCMTSNGSQLKKLAHPLFDAGVSRLNISLDTLQANRFRELTRSGDLHQVLGGIEAAAAAGFKRTKLNCVVMKGRNDDEVVSLVRFAIARGLDISFIEEMPLGSIQEHSRVETFCSSDEVRELVAEAFSLLPITDTTNGPSRYWRVVQAPDTRIGFISPHSNNFCGTCNRVRLTVEGRLLLCLGNEHSADLKSVLRANPGRLDALKGKIIESMNLKPWAHNFQHTDDIQVIRFMNMTGG